MKENVSGCFFLNTVYFVLFNVALWSDRNKDNDDDDKTQGN